MASAHLSGLSSLLSPSLDFQTGQIFLAATPLEN